jgi:hypothetical protein
VLLLLGQGCLLSVAELEAGGADQPLCFILMPFEKKPDRGGGADIDFDRVYEAALEPGIKDAGMIPIRADEEEVGGIIHQAMSSGYSCATSPWPT